MIASRISFGRNVCTRKKRMPNPSHSNKSVSKQSLRANLWRGGTQHADLQINLPLPKRARILLGLGRETQANARRSPGDGRDQGSGQDVHKPFVGANGESPFERCEVQPADLRTEDRQHVPAERMDAL